MIKLVIIVAMTFSCAIEEEPSTGISSWATENSQVGDAPISFERADVNADGVVNLEDLTAVAYWFGETGDDQTIERGLSSDLLTNSTVEVGRPFKLTVSADLSMGLTYPQEFASDFVKGGAHDETCKITVELQAVDGDGQVVDDAIVGFGHDLDELAYQPSVDMSGNATYHAWVMGYFTDSAQENGVEKLVVKSGSVCQDKITQPVKVRELTVNVAQRSDSREVQGKITEAGNLVINFSPQPDTTSSVGVVAMVVGEDRLQRGYFNSAFGIYHRAYSSGGNHYGSGFFMPQIGFTHQNQELDYTIYSFKRLSELGEDVPEICVAGDRLFVLLTKLGENDYGQNSVVSGSERLYENDCLSAGQ